MTPLPIMAPLPINTNSEFVVTLTKFGAVVYNAHYWRLPVKHRPPIVKEGDEIKSELWHLMHVFGPHMINGGEVSFKDNKVTLTEIR